MTDQAASQEGAPKVNVGDLPAGTAPDQAYVDKMLGAQHGDPALAQPKPQGPQRPEGIQEQFWDAEKGEVKVAELAKSYAELRAKMDSGAAKEPPAGDPAGDAAGKPKVTIEKPAGAPAEPPPLTAAIASFEERFNASGEVTDDDYAALEALGLPRQKVEIYMAGLAALEAQTLSEAHQAAGGPEKFAAAQDWARANLSDADLAYYNKAVEDAGTRKQGVEWLMAKFSAARPSEGALLTDTLGPGADAGDVFQSQEQVTAAQRDPRYKSDPAYRKSVGEKLLRSQRAGTINVAAEFYSRT